LYDKNDIAILATIKINKDYNMDKKTSINSCTFFMAALALLSAHTFADPITTSAPGSAPATIIKYASGDVLTWKGGQFVTISRDLPSGKKIASLGKMSKHLGVIESIAKGPVVPNTLITWAAFSATGSHICGVVEESQNLVVCGKAESISKADTLKAIESNTELPAITQALTYLQKGLGIKELNEAIQGLKTGDKYKGFQDGSAFVEIETWRQSRGWFKDDAKAKEYADYDMNTLVALSKTGDLRALQLMASRARSTESRSNLYMKAAAYGSTSALMSLVGIIRSASQMSTKKGDDKKPFVMDILAYYETARLRCYSYGDVISKQSTLISNMDVQVTAEETAAIQVAAKTIYDRLQKKRLELGLGEFDNTVPESVKTYYEMRKNDIEG
jgi:hypothetical protein